MADLFSVVKLLLPQRNRAFFRSKLDPSKEALREIPEKRCCGVRIVSCKYRANAPFLGAGGQYFIARLRLKTLTTH
jgi:hypothetical protein